MDFPNRNGFEATNVKGKIKYIQTKGGVNMPLPLASVDKLIRKAGAYRVSEGAAKELAPYLEDLAVEIAREAITLAEHAGRKTVKAEDINLARKRTKVTLGGQIGEI